MENATLNKIRTVTVNRYTGEVTYGSGIKAPQGSINVKDGSWWKFSENSMYLYYQKKAVMAAA